MKCSYRFPTAWRLKPLTSSSARKWPHIWRVVGQYANVSIFDVASNDELHTLLGGLPLFPYMKISVTPLTRHPSAIAAD